MNDILNIIQPSMSTNKIYLMNVRRIDKEIKEYNKLKSSLTNRNNNLDNFYDNPNFGIEFSTQ